MSALGVVGPAGDSPRADRARTSGAERAARAHAQDAQGRDRPAATAHARRSAAAVRLVPAALQHRAAARSARPAPARAPVPRVAASLPHHALADPVSGALCSAAGESQRWHSLGQSLGEREPRARGTRRGFRGNRRRTLGGVLRSGLARPAPRDHLPDRGSSGPRRPPRRREPQRESVTYQLITNCYLSPELFTSPSLAGHVDLYS